MSTTKFGTNNTNPLHLPRQKRNRRERGRSLLYFPDMNSDLQVREVERLVNDLLADDQRYFLVETRIKPTNNIKIFIDGDAGITIEKCIAINRALYKQIEGSGLFPNDDFSLEVSSPGLDEPLKMHRQYIKNVGRFVEVTQNDGLKTEGKLLEATNEAITVEEERGKNKKKEFIKHTINFDNIKSTLVQIKFK